jgi:hypothetical protein
VEDFWQLAAPNINAASTKVIDTLLKAVLHAFPADGILFAFD